MQAQLYNKLLTLPKQRARTGKQIDHPNRNPQRQHTSFITKPSQFPPASSPSQPKYQPLSNCSKPFLSSQCHRLHSKPVPTGPDSPAIHFQNQGSLSKESYPILLRNWDLGIFVYRPRRTTSACASL